MIQLVIDKLMVKVRSLLKCLFLLLLSTIVRSQNRKDILDSLHHVLSDSKSDTTVMFISNDLATYYVESNRDSGEYYIDRAIQLAKKLKQPLWEAEFNLVKSYYLVKKGNLIESFRLANEILPIAEDERNETGAFLKKGSQSKQEITRFRKQTASRALQNLGYIYGFDDKSQESGKYYRKALQYAQQEKFADGIARASSAIGSAYLKNEKLDSALVYIRMAKHYAEIANWRIYIGIYLADIGEIFFKKQQYDSAKLYFLLAENESKIQGNLAALSWAYNKKATLFERNGVADSMLFYAKAAFHVAQELKSPRAINISAEQLSSAWQQLGIEDSALKYLSISKRLGDSLYTTEIKNISQFQSLGFVEQLRLEKESQLAVAYKNKVITIALLSGLFLLSLLTFFFFRRNRLKQKINQVLQEQKDKVESTLQELKSTQSQLIQSEKMASLGELTAGIAHEIQNPLNFVNNFSEVNKELLAEMKDELAMGNYTDAEAIALDVMENEEKINHHGKRADAIVKGMLQHSQSGSGIKEPTDINALADEYLRLAYHGFKGKDKSFIADLKIDFDEQVGNINIIPQDIGRVLLNLINNAFYTVNEKQKEAHSGYEPTVWLQTKRSGDKVEISIRDNGNGIPEKIKDKIFQPFFTTKPTGQGTGLGLSLSYDSIKAHQGKIDIINTPGEGAEFIISLPLNT
jgi:two-component system, NtrC family, sensor kinase